MMDFRQLRYFITIVESGSFSRAAERLHVAQPSLSQHVLSMEAEYGVPLLHRSARGVRTTEAGERLLAEARKIKRQFDGLESVVRGRDAMPSGDVRLGMPAIISAHVGVPIMEATQDKYPDINLRITHAYGGMVIDWLRDDLVDLAMFYDAADMRGLTRHEALTEDIALYGAAGTDGAPKGSSISLQSALRLPLVLPSPSHPFRTLIDAAAVSIGEQVHPTIEIDSYRQIKSIVERGSAFAMLPSAAIEAEVMSGTLRAWKIRKPEIKRRAVLAYRDDKHLTNAGRAIAILAWKILRKNVQSESWQAQWTGVEELSLD